MLPGFIARINFKPLGIPFTRLDSRNLLKRIQRDVLKVVEARIQQEAFSQRAKKALAKGLSVKLGSKSLTIVARHPAFLPLVKGRQSKQMTWLSKSRRPIPILLDNGKLIFRSATARSMASGGWVHPGHRPTNVIEKSRGEIKTIVIRYLREDLKKKVR